ncbi:hypothetical protein [Nocardioides sp. W7]|uniref:hypothetical protein n=1 Tax=Nocardioides sp. W7 TaxID=2931390 RepID=UPI001FD370AC|nr:hypothetical protein [Nocardioides sp. W7]
MSETNGIRRRATAILATSALLATPALLAPASARPSAAEEPCTKVYGVRVQLLKSERATRGGAVLKITNAARCPRGRFKVRWPGGSKTLRIRPDSVGVARLRLPRLTPGDRVTVVYRSHGQVAGRDRITIRPPRP